MPLPTMEVPIAPAIPAGWSLSPDGVPLTPEGIACPAGATWPEGVVPPAGWAGEIGVPTGGLPVLSIGAGALLGYFAGGKHMSWTALGAVIGWYLHPLE